MRPPIFSLGIAGTFLSATAVIAEPTWNSQFRFRVTQPGSSTITIPSGGSMPLATLGTTTITLQVGIFNLQGQAADEANHGLYGWSGRFTTTGLNTAFGDALLVDNTTSRQGVFNDGPATQFGGFVTAGGTVIEGNLTPGSPILAARAINPTPPIVWPVDGPQPIAPPEFGADGFVNVFTFRVQINSFVDTVLLTADGSAGPILRWGTNSVIPPDGMTPGSVDFLGRTASPSLVPHSPAYLTFGFFPSPGTASTFALAGIFAFRRHRRE